MKKYTDIKYGEYSDNLLDIHLPDCTEFPVFVYFHGGGIETGSKENFIAAEYLTNRGIAFVSANYRMYPEAEFPQFIEDAAACVAWVKNNISDYGKANGIYVGGSSAGGYLSMMLCFDKKYLAKHNIHPCEITGFIHDAGQPTCHYNVLRERGIDTRRVIVDEASPIFHAGTEEKYAPMLFIVSDNDIENRYEQTKLMISTLKYFGHTEPDVQLIEMHGSHCEYVNKEDEKGESIFGKIIYEYINR